MNTFNAPSASAPAPASASIVPSVQEFMSIPVDEIWQQNFHLCQLLMIRSSKIESLCQKVIVFAPKLLHSARRLPASASKMSPQATLSRKRCLPLILFAEALKQIFRSQVRNRLCKLLSPNWKSMGPFRVRSRMSW